MQALNKKQNRPKRPHPWQRRRRKILLILCVVILLPLLVLSAYRMYLVQQTKAEFARIQEAGFPVTLAELDAWYVHSPEADARAADYAQAFTLLRAALKNDDWEILPRPFGRGPAVPRAKVYTGKIKKLLKAHLELNGEALRALHEVNGDGPCRYPVDLTLGYAAESVSWSQIRRAVNLLGLQADLAAQEGRSEEATRAMCTALALATTLREEPLLVSQMTRISCISAAANSLMRVLTHGELTIEQIERLAKAVDAARAPDGAIRAFAGERCMLIHSFDLQGSMGMNNSDPLVQGAGRALELAMELSGLREMDLLFSLDITHRYIAAAKQPRADGLTALRLIGDELDEKSPYTALISFILLPGIGQSLQTFAREDATMDNMATALAIERYRMDRDGALPEKLSALLPEYLEEIPLDPFDGQPMRYRLMDQGYVLYSVGWNLVDNGGVEIREQNGKTWSEDYVFRVER
jgi:hypothetical protein